MTSHGVANLGNNRFFVNMGPDIQSASFELQRELASKGLLEIEGVQLIGTGKDFFGRAF